MSIVNVKLGFVPSYRSRWGEWEAKMRDDSLAAMAGVDGVEIIVPEAAPDGETLDPIKGHTRTGGVQNLDEAEVIAEYFMREKIDGLVLCPVDFGDERSASKIAEKLGVPVLLYATKEPPARANASMSRVSDSYCGNLSMASGLYRRKIPFHYAGLFFPEEAEFATEVETFARAVAVVKGLRNARIGQIGVRPMTFETVGYDENAMITKFGQNVVYANLADIVYAAKALADDDPDVQAAIDRLKESVPSITVADDYVINSAKVEVAMANFFTKYGLSAMTMQCWSSIQREMGVSTCALFGRLTERHMLTACETDVLGALAMMTNYYAALGETLPHFVDWTIQHREDPNCLLSWHCGNAPVSLATNPADVALRSRYDMKGTEEIKDHDVQAGLYQFQIKPGKVTFCRLAEYDNEWKMLIATGDIIPSDETLAGTWSWVKVTDHAKLYRTLVEEGFIHHASMIHGDQTAALLQVCKFLDITPVVVE